MPALRITPRHFSLSDAMKRCRSSGVEPAASMPLAAVLFLKASSASTALTMPLSLVTCSRFMPLGATSEIQVMAS